MTRLELLKTSRIECVSTSNSIATGNVDLMHDRNCVALKHHLSWNATEYSGAGRVVQSRRAKCTPSSSPPRVSFNDAQEAMCLGGLTRENGW